MTPLRPRMTEDMQRRGFAPHTQLAYLQAITQLVVYVRISPDGVTEDDPQQYVLYLHGHCRALHGHCRAVCDQVLLRAHPPPTVA